MADLNDSSSPTPSEMPDPSSSPTPSTDPASEPAPAAPRKSSSAGGRKKTSRRRKTTRRRSPAAGVKRGEPSPAPAKPPTPDRATVTEADVEIALREGGELLNSLACAAIGVEDDEWPEIFKFSDRDLRELKVPLARIANKRVALARVVQQSDEIVVSLKLGRWAADSIQGMTAARNHVRLNTPAEPEEEGPEGGEVATKVVAVPTIGRERPGPGDPPVSPAHGAGDS